MKSWTPEKTSDLPKVTQLIHDEQSELEPKEL